MQRLTIGRHAYEVRLDAGESSLDGVLTLTLDGGPAWDIPVATWRGFSLGVSGKAPHVWTAHELIVLPIVADEELEVIRLDEDVLQVFRIDDRWVVICETSIRVLDGDVPVHRIELGDVVDTVKWDGEVLTVTDELANIIRLTVDEM